ncbi:putative Na(+)/H(+) exchanger [Sinomonas cellulolyticus]|uniref:Na+/H+ antiporter n=1 Tax=Sinomonas cellulolyticus TaxID=2801916 RepID=A0ABS1K3T3_9MICC|nr:MULTISPECIES: Na+/H+ antiporter [Sinomonas]MBL0706180.1 Na+/H+ antiporter [Sinomonas cellulolyticus]GHG55380.1 putative Na(+)/H(+) exchanger [Sinomonas sp. KCTC 49339]
MLGLELIVVLGAAVVLGSVVARPLRVTEPVLYLLAGLLLSLVPVFRGVGLPPETVLLLFLPALLYWESLTTSLRELRRFIRGILLSATLLVVITAAVVASVAHALGLDWGSAWILGAAVAPTDATAVASLGKALPRRQMTVLRAESLVNDGTALVVYGVALSSATGDGDISLPLVSGEFVYSFVGGAAVGVAVGWAMLAIRRRIEHAMAGNAATVLTPFVAFLLGELIGASPVLAVVACGLYISRNAPLTISAHTRQQSVAFWSLVTFLLNGALFVLVGLELPSAVAGLWTTVGRANGQAFGQVLLISIAVYAAILVTRLAVLVVSAYLIRAIDRRPYQRKLRTTNRARVMSTTAGFRGAVSLAVALSIPDGGQFPERNAIVFITAFVVAASLVLQGMALPKVIRWSRIPEDTKIVEELVTAKRTSIEEALEALPSLAREIGADDDVLERIRGEYGERLEALNAGFDDEEHPAVVRTRQYRRLGLAMIARKRTTVVRLRDDKTIDDTVLRIIQGELDAEEVRLMHQQETE